MNDKEMLILIGSVLFGIGFLVYKIIKKKIENGEAIWEIIGQLLFLTIIVYVVFPMFVQWDADGNIYTLFSKCSMWECATYYTQKGEAYNVEKDYLVCEKNPKIKYKFEQSYLNREGYLIFDEENKYFEIKDGVFVNEKNNRVYDLKSGYWDAFGKFKVCEAKGIQIGSNYIVPYQEILYDYDIQFDWISVFSVVMYFPSILFIGFHLKMFKYYWNAFLKATPIPRHITYKMVQYAVIFFVPTLQMLCNEMILKSFLSSFIWIGSSTFLIYKFIPYEEGDTRRILNIEDENEAWYDARVTYPLKVMRENTDERQANNWQRLYLIMVCISYISWLIVSVLISIGG